MLKYKDGEQIIGNWQNNRLNGIAKVKKAGSEEFEFVIYMEDMLIMSNKKGLTGWE